MRALFCLRFKTRRAQDGVLISMVYCTAVFEPVPFEACLGNPSILLLNAHSPRGFYSPGLFAVEYTIDMSI